MVNTLASSAATISANEPKSFVTAIFFSSALVSPFTFHQKCQMYWQDAFTAWNVAAKDGAAWLCAPLELKLAACSAIVTMIGLPCHCGRRHQRQRPQVSFAAACLSMITTKTSQQIVRGGKPSKRSTQNYIDMHVHECTFTLTFSVNLRSSQTPAVHITNQFDIQTVQATSLPRVLSY